MPKSKVSLGPKSSNSETKLKTPEFKTPPGNKKAFEQLLDASVSAPQKLKPANSQLLDLGVGDDPPLTGVYAGLLTCFNIL